MFPYIVFFIVTLPIIECLGLYLMTYWIGLFGTVIWVILTGFCGAVIAKQQGLRYWAEMNTELDQGHQPTDAILHSVLITLAGIALILPGPLTDLAGILLLLPFVRVRLIRRATEWFHRYRHNRDHPASSDTVRSPKEYSAKDDVIDLG